MHANVVFLQIRVLMLFDDSLLSVILASQCSSRLGVNTHATVIASPNRTDDIDILCLISPGVLKRALSTVD